jgi:hypothetical protein
VTFPAENKANARVIENAPVYYPRLLMQQFAAMAEEQ